MEKRDLVFPFSKAMEVPHFPEKTADEGGESPGPDGSPVPYFEFAEVFGFIVELGEGKPDEKWSSPEKWIEKLRINTNAEKGDGGDSQSCPGPEFWVFDLEIRAGHFPLQSRQAFQSNGCGIDGREDGGETDGCMNEVFCRSDVDTEVNPVLHKAVVVLKDPPEDGTDRK